MKKNLRIISQVLLSLSPSFYYLALWPSLPEQVPTHFNAHMQADDYGSKTEMLVLLLFIAAVSFGVNLLITNMNRYDPKQRIAANSSLMIKFSWALTLFLTAISFFVVYQMNVSLGTQATAAPTSSPKYLVMLMGLLFAVIGNFMHSLKPNYFVGIRTPWNLEDEDNWRKTHQLASRLWFYGGLIIAASSLFVPPAYTFLCLAIGLPPLAVIPFVHSYQLFRKKKQNQTLE